MTPSCLVGRVKHVLSPRQAPGRPFASSPSGRVRLVIPRAPVKSPGASILELLTAFVPASRDDPKVGYSNSDT